MTLRHTARKGRHGGGTKKGSKHPHKGSHAKHPHKGSHAPRHRRKKG